MWLLRRSHEGRDIYCSLARPRVAHPELESEYFLGPKLRAAFHPNRRGRKASMKDTILQGPNMYVGQELRLNNLTFYIRQLSKSDVMSLG